LVPAESNKPALIAKTVDGIDDKIVPGTEHRFGVGCREELRHGAHVALGIDAADAFGHDFNFRAAHIGIHRMKLAIHIAHADLIKIDERKPANSRSRERFDRPGADPTDSDDTDVRGAQSRQRIDAKKASDAAEPEIEVAHRG
jgi:hypothetical protein